MPWKIGQAIDRDIRNMELKERQEAEEQSAFDKEFEQTNKKKQTYTITLDSHLPTSKAHTFSDIVEEV